MTEDLKSLYQREILAHAKAPHHRGPLPEATHEATCTNPLCGDKVTVRVVVKDGRVVASKFESRGCAIARGSASLMTTLIEGGTPEQLAELTDLLTKLVEGSVELGEEHALAPYRGVSAFPARTRCATLAWETLAKALGEPARTGPTE